MFFRAKPASPVPVAPIRPAVYNCSFCKKSHDEVRKLITGPGVNICEACVLVCRELLEKASEREEVTLAKEEALK